VCHAVLCCAVLAPQATCFQLLLAEGWPNSDEASLMRWAANSSSVAPPKHATRQQYKQATALEALVGPVGTKHALQGGTHREP